MNTTAETAIEAGSSPLHASKWLYETISGQKMDLLHPRANQINLIDVATGLSNICRYGGQIKENYNVAQHSVLVMYLAPMELRREALMHDAAEAFIGDMVMPLKQEMDAYRALDKKWDAVIIERFGLNPEKLAAVKRFDNLANDIEHDWLRRGKRSATLAPWLNSVFSHARAQQYFLDWCKILNIE